MSGRRDRCHASDSGQQRAARAADTRGQFAERERNSPQQPAAFGAQQFGFRDARAEALKLDIEIILQGKGDRVLKREVKVAAAQETLDAGGVSEIDRATSRGR